MSSIAARLGEGNAATPCRPDRAEEPTFSARSEGGLREWAEPTLICLSRAQACRDSVTSRHTDVTGALTECLCRCLGLDADRSHWIGQAARLHDIGKLATPWEILHKPGKLSPEEWAVVKRHPLVGHHILSVPDSPFLMLAADIAHSHHERFDGSGYPDGLAGWQIPLEARIVAVVDIYEALRANRSYRRGIDHPEALRSVLEGDERSSPDQLDPEVLQAFARDEAIVREVYAAAIA